MSDPKLVRIPASVYKIGKAVFKDCPRLNFTHIPASLSNTANMPEVLMDCKNLLAIYAPVGSAVERYANAKKISFAAE